MNYRHSPDNNMFLSYEIRLFQVHITQDLLYDEQ